MSPPAVRKVVIDPVTRVEGHGRVTIHLDEQGQVCQARFHVVEFRGFERFMQGRPYWEAPVIVQRLCGICPVSHHLAAAKAMDRIVGVDEVSPTADKMRRLMHYGQIYQSHALHFFHLSSPDLAFGFNSDPKTRNIVGVMNKMPELALQGVKMRKYGQELIKATAGKRIHGTGAVPGGVNKNLSIAERDYFLGELDQQLIWAQGALAVARNHTLSHLDVARGFATFDSNHLSLVAPDGAMELYDGALRAIDATGATLFDQVSDQRYAELLVEEVRDWSYMQFPFIRSLGPEQGWYRVGPLARLNTCSRIDTPLAEVARQDFVAATDGVPNGMSLAYHWARMIELLHAGEKVRELLNDSDLQGTELVRRGERRQEGVGVIEAPRGTLFHHYRVNEDDQITLCNLIVSTTSNNEAINRAVEHVARTRLSGVEITEVLLNQVEVAIRCYDPCLSCATHALGQMPLTVEVHDAAGQVLSSRST